MDNHHDTTHSIVEDGIRQIGDYYPALVLAFLFFGGWLFCLAGFVIAWVCWWLYDDSDVNDNNNVNYVNDNPPPRRRTLGVFDYPSVIAEIPPLVRPTTTTTTTRSRSRLDHDE